MNPSLIIRLQTFDDSRNKPNVEKFLEIDFGKINQFKVSTVKIGFVATNVSVSLIFPEEKKFRGIIKFQVYQTDFTFFLILAYLIIIMLTLMMIGMLCLILTSRCIRVYYVRLT